MQYRDITTDEVQSVTSLVRRVFSEFVAPEYAQEGIETFKEYIRPENLENALQNGTLFIIGCCEADELVGVIAVSGYAHISLLFVDKAYHGKQIARNLFVKALKRCIFKNPGLTEITVNASAYAVDVYRKLGFEAAGDRTTTNGITFFPMKMAFSIRTARYDELPQALGLLKEASQWLKSEGIDYWQDWQNPPDSFIEWVKKGLMQSQFYFFHINNNLCGMFRLQYEDTLFWGLRRERAGYLHSFTVKRGLHGMGLGHWLIEQIKQILSKNGIYILRLDCSSNIEGLCRYYKNEGFVEVGEAELFSERYTLYETRWSSKK
ncbi:MAG: GNAT family N-acetyltransferase [Bacillota bacterium]